MQSRGPEILLIVGIISVAISGGCYANHDKEIEGHDDRLIALERTVRILELESRFKSPESTPEPAVRLELRGVRTTDQTGAKWAGSITATSGPGKPCSPALIQELADGPTEVGEVLSLLEEHCDRLSVNPRVTMGNGRLNPDAGVSFHYYITEKTSEGVRVYTPRLTPTPAEVVPSPTP